MIPKGSKPLLILASASSERRRIIKEAGLACQQTPADVNENQIHGKQVEETVRLRAQAKAEAIAQDISCGVIIGADTVMVCGNLVIGKPRHRDHAREILEQASGQVHEVLTGVCMIKMPERTKAVFHTTTQLRMKQLSESDIQHYLESGEWEGKAGAYNYKLSNDPFVTEVTGLQSNIRGLPIEEILPILKDWHAV